MSAPLADFTTLRLGGPAARVVEATTNDELVDVVRAADSAGEPVLVVGGGSNLVVADEGWPGVVVLIRTTGIGFQQLGRRVAVTVPAGEPWDAVVELTVRQGWSGLAAMSGIPGLAGATPVQNVGAYGALTSDVLESVTVYDRQTGETVEWENARCEFGKHRHSAFKYTDRYLVLRVTYRLRRSRQSGPLQFADLVRLLDVEPGGSADPRDVRQAVLRLRAQRGSLLDPDDHDTWSVGSFFLHPIVPEVPPQAADSPAYPDPLGFKLPAGWLI